VTLVAIVVTNLPHSDLRRQAMRAGAPYLNAVGLDQAWALFGPEPRRASIALRARIEYPDGTLETWQPPVGGDLAGGYWDYHWQKWQEWVLDERHRGLWRPAAEYAVHHRARRSLRPTRVTLVRLTSLNHPPGRGPDHGPYLWRPYYSLRLP
jgi:hypothetical protein